MEKTLTVVVSLLLGAGSQAPAAGASASAARITYVANEGFLVSVGDSVVLVDGLYGGRPLDFADVPGEETVERLRTGAPPFADVRVALVTHRHVDHFDAAVAVAFLRSRPEAVLVGPSQVADDLRKTPGFEAVARRVHTASAEPGADESLRFGDVTVRALGIPHSPYMVDDPATGQRVNRHRNTQNLGYRVDVGGFTFFHNGDAGLAAAEDYCRFDLASSGVDVAFLGGVFWSPAEQTFETVRRCLSPANVVLMHLHGEEKAAARSRAQALEGFHPAFVVPGEPMTEVVLPESELLPDSSEGD